MSNKHSYFIISSTIDIYQRINLNSLPNHGRFDVICRSITASFFLSNNFRKNVNLYIYFLMNGELLFMEGSKVAGLNPDERSVAGLLKSVFTGRNIPGVSLTPISLEESLEMFDRKYLLYENGDPIRSQHLKKETTFILGDHLGFPEKVLTLLCSLPKVSLGKKSYLTSQCITILNFLLDNKLGDTLTKKE